MPHYGASPQSMYSTQGDCAHVKGWPRLTQGNEGLAAKLREGLVAKLRMGWEPLGSHPIRHLCCLFSNLSTLSSVASCLSALPFTLFRSANLRPTPLVKLASPAIPRVRPLASLHPSNLLPSTPRPSLARTLIPRSSSCPLISRTSTSRSPAAPVIHRNGTRTL